MILAKERNKEVRKAITESGFQQWRVAEAMGVGENTLIRWLRTPEMTIEQKQRVYNAIEKLKGAE